jgi:hypothetical protein
MFVESSCDATVVFRRGKESDRFRYRSAQIQRSGWVKRRRKARAQIQGVGGGVGGGEVEGKLSSYQELYAKYV